MSSSSPINPDGGSEPPRPVESFPGLCGLCGVGKTYRMLEEAQQLKRQGNDVVVGYFEPHERKDTIAKTVGLELIPRRPIAYRGSTFHDMDMDAILARHPATCVVDELALSYVSGSDRGKRWEDVQVLLDAGIDVMTNMNIQHLESLNDQIFQISGVRVRETVPDWFVNCAAEVVMVDATTGALLNRLKRGDIYASEKIQRAMENFFKESTLTALRELALRQAAHELEFRKDASASEAPQQEQKSSGLPLRSPKVAVDRVLIYVSADPSTAMLVRRGRRISDYLGAGCLAVAVLPRERSRLPKEDRYAG